MRIHRYLAGNTYPNSRRLAAALEVSAKTIQRDLDFMRDRLELPITYDPVRHGYHYTGPVTTFPSITVSEGEIVALFVARKALDQYSGTPFEAPLKAAFAKITEGMQDQVSFDWRDVDSAISFRGTGAAPPDLALFQLLSQAVIQQQCLAFRYRKLGSPLDETRTIEPYHLANVEGGWYLNGRDLMRCEMRTFALPRICDAQVLAATFQRPPHFDIREFLSGSFGVYSADEQWHAIVLHFDAFAGQLISERQWHHSQQIRPIGSGGTAQSPWVVELTLEPGSLEEIAHWILRWGRHCKVVAPPQLQARICEEIRAMAITNGLDQ